MHRFKLGVLMDSRICKFFPLSICLYFGLDQVGEKKTYGSGFD